MLPLSIPCVCSIKVTVIEDPKVIEKEYPLMYLVGRGCLEGVTLRPCRDPLGEERLRRGRKALTMVITIM
jgi:hypothetical protein